MPDEEETSPLAAATHKKNTRLRTRQHECALHPYHFGGGGVDLLGGN